MFITLLLILTFKNADERIAYPAILLNVLFDILMFDIYLPENTLCEPTPRFTLLNVLPVMLIFVFIVPSYAFG